MKKLIIIGAGDFGREVLNWAMDVEKENEWEIIGFLDNNPRARDGYDYLPPILGNPMEYRPHDSEVFICAIANPKHRMYLCHRLKAAGAIFTTLIHNTAIIGRNTIIEDGCIICPRVLITTDVHIGSHVIINVAATVGHDVVIGDTCTIHAHAALSGFVKLDQGVNIGSHVVLLPSAKVGEGATVCAGSVVLHRVKAGTTVMGIPAVESGGFKTFQKHNS